MKRAGNIGRWFAGAIERRRRLGRAATRARRIGQRRGAALLTVLGFMVLAASAAALLMSRAGAHYRQVRAQVEREQAFYIAEGGAERAASYLAAGGRVPATLTGTLGRGTYTTTIAAEGGGGGTAGSLSGRININPNNSPDNVFIADLPDGRQITRDDLHENAGDYAGPATLVQVMPKGPGTQNELYFNGTLYPIRNNTTYSFQSNEMTIRIYNDRRNPQGRAVGQWWVELQAPNAIVSDSDTGQTIRRDTYFTIYSTGIVGSSRRSVTIRGLHTVSWAKYALWYDNEATTLWIVGGEQFHGPVYSRPLLRFHSFQVDTKGQARFFDRALTVQSSIQLSDNRVQPIFDRGLTLNAPVQSMVSVDLNQLRSEASLILTGTTYITISSNRMWVTNARRGWTNQMIPVPDEGLIYVQQATTGDTSTRAGDLYLSAPNGLAGRLTLVADQDIYVTNHVRYARNPTVVEDSTDALGLIARRHTVVATNAPNNLEIFAHIICVTGGFGVARYDDATLGDRGTLLVYGGIVNRTRNAVGTFSSTRATGYRKNYVYDPRFRKQPPPRYPAIPNEFKWLGWDG